MNDRLAAAWAVLPLYLGEHVLLSAAAMGLGLALSLLLTIAAVRSPAVRWPVLLVASLVQTIPSLALLALFYPLLLALASVSERVFGRGFSALGFLPSLLALTLYSMLPVIRNGVTGVLGLDPALIEAARGVGMTDRQRLLRVELPLAAPVLMAGVRTAAVWVIGAATLSTPVGQTSLGNYIFSGLQVQNWVAVLFGCVAAATLALIVDQLLGLIESGIARRNRVRGAIGALALAAGVAAAALPGAGAGRSTYVIGAKSFSEQYILSALIADRIAAEGGAAARRTGLGSAIAFEALAAGDIDVYVDYSGTLWANVMGRSDVPPREQLLRELGEWLRRERGIEMVGTLGFENAYALAMRRDRAAELGVRTIDDLAARSGSLTLGADFEFFARPEWPALRDAYGLEFAGRREFQSTFMYRAVESREVDLITAFSSDGRIAADDLVVLDDPRGAILPYDAVVLVAARRAADPLLARALMPLIGAIPVDLMRAANYRVDRGDDPEGPPAAARWLADEIARRARQ
ncbi:MAG TPA: ABC transporter permease/substrate-binding protein [Gammaproteobacteria bacterium]|nr:ABC transporter permease/substrate-binding protein [Gammaproteobacteria bacterium]